MYLANNENSLTTIIMPTTKEEPTRTTTTTTTEPDLSASEPFETTTSGSTTSTTTTLTAPELTTSESFEHITSGSTTTTTATTDTTEPILTTYELFEKTTTVSTTTTTTTTRTIVDQIIWSCSFGPAANMLNQCGGSEFGIGSLTGSDPTFSAPMNDYVRTVSPRFYVTDYISICNFEIFLNYFFISKFILWYLAGPTSIGISDTCKIPFILDNKENYFCLPDDAANPTDFFCETQSGLNSSCVQGNNLFKN